MLNVVLHGAASDRPPLLVAHGLYGSARNWGAIARRLSDSRLVAAVDMRNHGASPWQDTNTYPDMAGDLAAVIEELGGKADVLGHSMGGKAAMVLAVTRPRAVRRLVVADIAPVAYDHTQIHLIEAMRRIDPTQIGSRGEADRALAADVPEPAVRAFLLQSLDLKEHRWRLNFDALAAAMDEIIGFPTLDGQFDGPTLFLSGGASGYVRPEHRPVIRQLFPAARLAKIPGAGHWLHAEKPREFEAAVRAFLDAPGRDGPLTGD